MALGLLLGFSNKMKQTLLLAAALGLTGYSAQATQIFEYVSDVPVSAAGVFQLHTDDNDDNLTAQTPEFPRQLTYLTESDIPDVWARITDNNLERFGWAVQGFGLNGPEDFFFPSGEVPDSVTFLRIDFPNISGTDRIRIAGFDGPVPTPDATATAPLLALGLFGLTCLRRMI